MQSAVQTGPLELNNSLAAIPVQAGLLLPACSISNVSPKSCDATIYSTDCLKNQMPSSLGMPTSSYADPGRNPEGPRDLFTQQKKAAPKTSSPPGCSAL